MREKEAKTVLSPQNGMNIYRGCTFGCLHCDPRAKCYRNTGEFEDIEVKVNAVELLEKSLRSKRRHCMIGVGSMSDPYQPIEEDLKLMRKSQELINTTATVCASRQGRISSAAISIIFPISMKKRSVSS